MAKKPIGIDTAIVKDTSGIVTSFDVPTATQLLSNGVNDIYDQLDERMVSNNIIIGGDFGTNPWQRGTTFTSPITNTYTADRWRYVKSDTAILHTITQDTSAPSISDAGCHVSDSLTLTLTAGKQTLSDTELVALVHNIEGYNFSSIAKRPSTLSFWVKAAKIGTYCVSFRNSGSDRYYIAEYTINAASTWEKKIIVIPASPVDGTWNYTNGLGLQISFILACGQNNQGITGSWQNGNEYSTVNQVNGVYQNSSMSFALIQLEPGIYNTLYNRLPHTIVKLLCMRYYMRLGGSSKAIYLGASLRNSGGIFVSTLSLPVETRISPSALKVGTWTTVSCGQPVIQAATQNTVSLSITSTSIGNATCQTVDASTYIELNAEF